MPTNGSGPTQPPLGGGVGSDGGGAGGGSPAGGDIPGGSQPPL